MRDFAFDADFPHSKFCWLMPFVNFNRGAEVSLDKEIVGTDEVGAASGAFALLAGCVLGAAVAFGEAFGTECSFRLTARVLPSLW